MKLTKQIELLKKYGITEYTINNNHIEINGSLDLRSLTSADKDFLKGTTINGYLYLRSLTSADKDFLKGTTINGYLDLRSLTSADKDFLKGTTINGSLFLKSLTSADKDFLKANVKGLKEGYNARCGYCFFDGILSQVLSVHTRKEYTLYKTPFEFIAQKGKYTAHGKNIKKAIEDCEFKTIAEKLKKDPIKEDTVITIQYYRIITGACESGAKNFQQQHKLKDSYKAKDLLPILENNDAYGVDKFKQLITF
jgi:hypothetical protein